jgi:type IV pilus assembly protein PilF
LTHEHSHDPHPSRQTPGHFNAGRHVSPLLMRWVLILSVIPLLFLPSCASTPKQEDITNAEAYNTMAYSYLKSGKINEAYIEFQKAIALNPKNKEALQYLGYISRKFGKYDEAISYLKRAIAVDRNNSEALNDLGVVYAEMRNWDEAVKCFKEALRNPLYASPALAYANLGYAYYMIGDYDNAQKALKESLLRNPVSPRAMYTLGLVYLKTHDNEAAIEEFKRAIGIQSDYTDAHWELAKVYIQTGNKAKALKHLKMIIEKDDNPERVREASEYMKELKY